MRMTFSGTLSAAVLAATLTMPLVAMAQTKDATAAPAANREAMVEQRIADMHASLNITAAQETEFGKFSQVMLDNAQAMDALGAKDTGNRDMQTADQILKGYAQYSAQHAENLQKLSAEFSTLYASLSPEQKKQADEMFRQRAEMHDQKQGAAMQPATKNGG